MRSWKWYSKVLFVLVLVAFGWWVWPTPWETYRDATGGRVRVNRFTNRSQELTAAGWLPPSETNRILAKHRRGTDPTEHEDFP